LVGVLVGEGFGVGRQAIVDESLRNAERMFGVQVSA
jgi:hypothetical protein